MRIRFFPCGLLLLILILPGCDKSGGGGSHSTYESSYDRPPSQQTYEETKMSLEDKERMNPVQFLSSKGTYRKNIFGEFVLEGKVHNAASVVTFKDIILDVSFYSKTNSHIRTVREVVYEYVKPGRSRSFKVKLYGPKGAKSVGWEVVGARSAN